MKKIVTKYGQRMHVRLSDGSIVILNAGSKLIVPEQFKGTVRKVTLIGEAYFKVTENPDKPFVIRAKNGIIKVLGTRFIVQAYPKSKQLTVAVAEGKVALKVDKKTYATFSNHITKNQKAILHENGRISFSKISNIENYLGWTEGKLVFTNAPIKKVDRQLERWYAIKVQFKESVPAKLHLTASYTVHQRLKEVLDAIALSLDLQYIKENRTVTFYNTNSK